MLEGYMSCEKRFAMVLSWVGFGHIKIAFIALCVLLFGTSQLSNTVKIKVTVNAYGYDYIHTTPAIGVVCCHISVGFLLFIEL